MSSRAPAPLGLLLSLLLGAALHALLSSALAHATLVLGTVAFTPDPPVPGQPAELRIELHDPTLAEVEDAIVFVEIGTRGGRGDEPAVRTDRLDEPQPAVYVTQVVLQAQGEHTLRIIDRTFRQEEAIAELEVTFGAEPVGSLAFVLPPTATGPQDILSWLAWVIGLPLLAGVIVTVLVLRGGGKGGDEADPRDSTTEAGAANDDGDDS